MKALLALLTTSALGLGAPANLQKRQDEDGDADDGACMDQLTPEKLDEIMTSPDDITQCGPGETGDSKLTCTEAHPFILDALTQYGFTSCGAIAYYLSYLSFESASLQYVTNQFPGRPGQGTYSMMMPDNLAKFVIANPDLDLPPETRDYAENGETDLKALGLFDGIPDDADQATLDAAAALNTFLEPLLANEVAFLPAAWYYSDATTIDECKGAIAKMETAEGVEEVLLECTGVGEEGMPKRMERHEAFLMMLTGEGAPVDEITPDAPVDVPVEEPVDAPVEEPVDAPVDTPVEDPVTPPPADGADPETPPPADGTDPVTPPADGDNGVMPPPAEGADPVTPPPADGADPETPPPADGTDPVTPPADGDDGVMPPPADGDEPITPPPAEDVDPVAPPGDGTDPVTPPADGDNGVMPPPGDGDEPITPPPAEDVDPVTPPGDGTEPVTPPPSDPNPSPDTPECTLTDSPQPTCLTDRKQIYLCHSGQWVGIPLPEGTTCTCIEGDEDGCPGLIGWET